MLQDGTVDDSFVEIPISNLGLYYFQDPYLPVVASVFMSSNSFLTMDSGSVQSTDFSLFNPALGKLLVAAGDH